MLTTVKPKDFTEWAQLCIKYRYTIYDIKYGAGGQRMDQCLDEHNYPQGIWNHTKNVGYLFEPEQK